VKKKQISEPVI